MPIIPHGDTVDRRAELLPAHLLPLFSDASFMLEKLIKGLRKKRTEGTWDRTLTAKEPPAEYIAEDADVLFALPEDSGQV